MTVVIRRGKLAFDYKDQHGKRHVKVLPKGTTRKQAAMMDNEIRRSILKETFIDQKDVPLFIEVANDWLNKKR